MKIITQKPIFDIFSPKDTPSGPSSEKKAKHLENKQKIKIIIDYREKNSLVASYLISLGFEIEFKESRLTNDEVKEALKEFNLGEITLPHPKRRF